MEILSGRELLATHGLSGHQRMLELRKIRSELARQEFERDHTIPPGVVDVDFVCSDGTEVSVSEDGLLADIFIPGVE